MTQPEAPAVGGDDQHVVAHEPTAEERLNAAFADPENHKEEDDELPAEGEDDAQAEPEPEVTEDDLGDEADELPPIDAPVSWDAESKELFKTLPREAQEIVQKREAERERFVQSKSQEAAQSKQAAQLEALQTVEQIKAQAIEQLQSYARQFEVEQPDPRLITANPELYAQQLATYQYATAQREAAQRDAERAQAEQANIRAAREQHEAEMFHQRLSAELPELLDPSTGQKLAGELAATAQLLGFDPHQISDVSAMKALKVTSEWKTKADKYDALQRKKMERVRAGKTLPPVSKPGAPRAPGAAVNAQYQADRNAMRSGDKDAERRVLDSFFTNPK